MSGNYNDTLLNEVSRPALFSSIAERAIVNNNPLFAMIAGKYDGEMSKKVKPAFQEETKCGSGYFENFIVLKSNGNIDWVSREQSLPTVELDLGDRPKVPVQNLVGTIPLYIRDTDLNSGDPDKLQDILKLALEQGKDTADNLMGVAAFALGTEKAGKIMWGLRYWLPDTVTSGSVAGIDQGVETVWRPYVKDATSASFATYGSSYIETMFLETAYNGNFTDLAVTDNTTFGYLKAIIIKNERYVKENEKLRTMGFPQSLEVSGRAFIADPNCTAGTIFALCTKKVKVLVVKGCSFTIGKFIEPVDGQFKAAKLTFRGNMAFLTRRPNGKIINFTTA